MNSNFIVNLMGYLSVVLAKVQSNIQNIMCTQDHGQYLDKFMPFCFFYNHGIKELITHYCDSIHHREYHNFYYRDSIIFTIAQP